MTLCARCLDTVTEGPATTGEIAAEVGVESRTVCATMRHLMKRGLVARGPYRKPRTGAAGRLATSIWQLSGAERAG